jgi:peptidoglycan/xylan/chitin deacetylase (PgdA/CDA1 family)
MTTIPILLYHSVSRSPESWIAPYTVTPEMFARQLDAIVDRRLTPMTISALNAAVRGDRPLPERPVAITFDDGFSDFTGAAAMLDDRGMPSTLYVTTGAMRGRSARPADMAIPPAAMLHWSDLIDLHHLGVEVGSHTHTHPQLDTLPPRTVADEVRRSKGLLEDVLGHPVPAFAYPHGFHSARTRRIVADAGHTSAAAVMDALSSDRDHAYSLARLTVKSDTTVAAFGAWLDGRGARIAPFPESLRTRAWRTYRRTCRGRATRRVISTPASNHRRHSDALTGEQ